MTTTPVFPLYRKYPDGRVYFKVLSFTAFEELKKTPRGWESELHRAKVHPDRVLIADMIAMRGGWWVEASSEEFLNPGGERE